MTIPNAIVEGMTTDGELLLSIPPAFRDALRVITDRCFKNHNSYCKVSVDIPFKPRTFGPKSQSAHLHGHLQQLAVHFGYTLQEMKEVMKGDVPEWPTEERRVGHRFKVRPVSEASVSTFVESRAIEWCHLIAAEEGLVLIEEKETAGVKN